MDVWLSSKYAPLVTIFVSFSVAFFLLCSSPATTLLTLTQCLHYFVASFNYDDSGARDAGPVDHLQQLLDSISTCDVNRGSYMLLLVSFVLLFCLFVFFFFFIVYSFVYFFHFFRDSYIISITAAEFRYYVVVIILVNLGKP